MDLQNLNNLDLSSVYSEAHHKLGERSLWIRRVDQNLEDLFLSESVDVVSRPFEREVKELMLQKQQWELEYYGYLRLLKQVETEMDNRVA